MAASCLWVADKRNGDVKVITGGHTGRQRTVRAGCFAYRI